MCKKHERFEKNESPSARLGGIAWPAFALQKGSTRLWFKAISYFAKE